MIENASSRGLRDALAQILGPFYDTMRVEDHDLRAEKRELFIRFGNGDSVLLRQALLYHIEHLRAQILQNGKRGGIDHRQALGRDLVAQRMTCPCGKIVVVFGFVELRAQPSTPEMIVHAAGIHLLELIAQLTQVPGAAPGCDGSQCTVLE